MGLEGGVSFLRRWETELLIMEGASRQDLVARARGVQRYLEGAASVPLRDVAFSLNCPLEGVPCRLCIVASSPDDGAAKLERALDRLKDPACVQIKDRAGIYFFEKPLAAEGGLAFLFPGEGSQYINMLADLCVHFPEVRAAFDLIDRAFVRSGEKGELPGHSVFPPPGAQGTPQQLWEMESAVAAVSAADRALLLLLNRLGLRPDAVLGHSTGEYTAFEAAGMTELEDAARYEAYAIALKEISRRVVSTSGVPRATLVAVGADVSAVSALIRPGEADLHIAMDNCPHQVVVAGPEEPMATLVDELGQRGLIYQRLPFDRPYHTPLFEPYAQHLRPFFAEWLTSRPRVPLYSCTTSTLYPDDLEQARRLALEHWVRPVQFRQTIQAMYDDGMRTFVQVGPKGNLAAFVDDTLRDAAHLAVPLDIPLRSGITQLNHALGLLAAQGVSMQLDTLYARREPQRLQLDGDAPPSQRATRPMRLELALPMLRLAEPSPATTSGEGSVAPVADRSGDDGTSSSVPARPLESDRLPGRNREQRVEEPAANTADPSRREEVLRGYLRTMEHFLNVQQEVMQAFLADGRDTSAVARTGPGDSAAVAADQGPGTEAGFDPVAAGSQAATDADLAGPLTEPWLAPTADGSMTPPGVEPPTPKADIAGKLLSLVSEKTGYPADMLDLDLNLEADLGIDSIKRVEILGALQRETAAFGVDALEQVAGLKTLRSIIEFMEASDGAASSLAAADGAPEGDRADRDRERSVTPLLASLPFVGEVVSIQPGEEVVTTRLVDLEEDIFLRDHTLGGQVSEDDPELMALPVMPLTMSMEMLAETAALLVPDGVVVGMEDIRAHQWIGFDEGSYHLRIVARRQAGDCVRVAMYDDDDTDGAQAVRPPLVEGTVCFGGGYPPAPTAARLTLASEQPFPWAPDQLYSEGMFHGPSFRGVVSADRWGEDGAEVTLQSLPSDGLLRSRPNPSLLIDPVLLDAAGQLVGYWAAACLETGFNVFPFRLERLMLYGPALSVSERAACQARITRLGDTGLSSDIDVITSDRRVRMRLVGWEDRRFDVSKAFQQLRISTRDTHLSREWAAPVRLYNDDVTDLVCRRVDEPAGGFFEAHGMIWSRVLAHLVLSRAEREVWRRLKGPPKRRIEWLLARVAAKDAVRVYLGKRHGLALHPADVEIASDAHARPLAGGSWAEGFADVPTLSMSHSGRAGVAVAAPGGFSVGVDIESVGHVDQEKIARLAFTPDERALLSRLEEAAREEWALRLWCAKEAVAKALGRGMVGGPQALSAVAMEASPGTVDVCLRGEMAELFPDWVGETIKAATLRESDAIVATCLLETCLFERT